MPAIRHEKLRKDGQPRRKPGPKPKLRIQASEVPLENTPKLLKKWTRALGPPPGTVTIEEALKRCEEAYGQTQATWMRAHGIKPDGPPPAEELMQRIAAAACQAYVGALPHLSAANASAYVACVARGVALDVFTGKQASQLLYAAQVAASAARAIGAKLDTLHAAVPQK
jgi:hypothetical protein